MDFYSVLVLAFCTAHILHVIDATQELDSPGDNGLRIGAFNIQVFGVTKMENRAVVEILVKVISRYDILLIQEIRDITGTAIEELLNMTNVANKDSPFSMKISPRLGRTSSKEQYAFFYRPTAGIAIDSVYVYDDGEENEGSNQNSTDEFEREPFVIEVFSSTTALRRFALVGIHVSPSEAVKEIQTLGKVFEDVKSRLGISEVMVLGDLNAECSYVPQYQLKNMSLRNDPKYTWWIDESVDTTVGDSSCAYDRLISVGEGFRRGILNGSATVFDFQSAFQLNQSLSEEVSDHFPVEFVLLKSSETSGTPANEKTFLVLIINILYMFQLFLC